MNPLIVVRIVFSLGIINVISGILIFVTCRCLPGSRIGKRWMANKYYQRFFKLHCFIWWIFWISVMIHAILVFIYIGLPG